MFPMSKHNALVDFINRACPMMVSYQSDLLYELEKINNMDNGDIMYVIVRPYGSHTATPFNIKQVFEQNKGLIGNYVVIGIKNYHGNYFVWNVDKKTDIQSEWEHMDKDILPYIKKRYDGFEIEKDDF